MYGKPSTDPAARAIFIHDVAHAQVLQASYMRCCTALYL